MAQVLPTLPPRGIAASVEILKVLEGQIHDRVSDPDSLLLPEEEWPAKQTKAKTMMKDGLHYPASAVMCYDAEFLGAQQGRNWKYPLMCVNWKHHLDKPIPQVREELGIYPIIPDGLWDKTDLLCDEGVMAGEKNIPYSAAAE